MARSKDAPKLKWEWKNCISCNQKFRYVLIDGTAMKEATCKKCTYKTCPICRVHHQAGGACCSEACTAKKRETTNTELYGSSNVFASDTIKDRIKETLVVKYGVNHPGKSDIVKDKIKKTCVEKYGVTNPAKSEDIKKKMRQTCQDKYGVDFVFQAENFKQNAAETYMKKYGVPHNVMTPEHKQAIEEANRKPEKLKKFKDTLLERYGVSSPLQLPQTREKCNNDESLKKRRETMRHNKSWVTSKPEDALYARLCEFFGDVQRQATVNRWSIDFYIPSIDTYINMNGIYWHGRGKTEEELLSSNSKQDKTILSTVKRDKLRESWFRAHKKRLVIVWEDEIESTTIQSFQIA